MYEVFQFVSYSNTTIALTDGSNRPVAMKKTEATSEMDLLAHALNTLKEMNKRIVSVIPKGGKSNWFWIVTEAR